MTVQSLSSDRYSASVYRGSAAEDRFRILGCKRPGRNASRAADAPPAKLDGLAVVLSASEPHLDVAVRAQLLAQSADVSRAALLIAKPSLWRRFLHSLPMRRSGSLAPGTDVSLRVLRASLPREGLRVGTCASASDVLRHATDSDLVVVGRRRPTPWACASLARRARRLLRRTRAPVLVVGPRPRGAYRKVVLATDLRTDPGSALEWARLVAPEASIALLHVYRGPFEGSMARAGVAEDAILQHRLEALRRAAFRMKALLDRHRRTPHAVIAHGCAIHDVLRKAGELDADLIVVVRSMHSWWADILGASVSAEIAARAERDVLVVHAAASERFGLPAVATPDALR